MPERSFLLPALAAIAVGALLLTACGDEERVSPPATSRLPSELEGPTWVLDVGQLPVQGDVLATIRFLEGQVAGTAGCNSFTGTYVVDGSSLTLSPLATTGKLCPPPADRVEAEVLRRLGRVDSFRLDGEALELKAGDDVLLRYEANSPTIEGAWRATSVLYDDAIRSVVLDTELTATFQPDGSVFGRGGCNSFTGGYATEGASISIGPLASTRMACEEETMDQETGYFAALESATRWEQVGGKLTLLNAEGQQAVSFERA
jgi:heat shock protein HslJ